LIPLKKSKYKQENRMKSRKNLRPKNSIIIGGGGGLEELRLAHEEHAPMKQARKKTRNAKNGWKQHGWVAEHLSRG
jgi:hypothetical protein